MAYFVRDSELTGHWLFSKEDFELYLRDHTDSDLYHAYQALHPELPLPKTEPEGDEGHYQEEIRENREMASEALGIVRSLRKTVLGTDGRSRTALDRSKLDQELQRVHSLLVDIALEGIAE